MKELWADKKKRYLILLTSLAFLLITHSYQWMNAMYTHDSLLIVQEDSEWQISLGRIFNPVYVWLRGRIVAPGNVALFASIFLIISVALVIHVLRLKKTISIILCCGFMTTFETIVSVNGVFLLSLDLDMLALLFSVLAACFFMGRESTVRFIAGVGSIALVLGLFQSYVEVTIMLICLNLLRELLEGSDAKKSFVKGLRSVGLLILGGILYYICLRVVLRSTGIAPADTNNGLVQIKSLTFPSVVSLAKEAWKYSLHYLFSGSLIAHRTISGWVYRILGFFSLLGIVWIAAKKRLRPAPAVLIIFLLVIMPLGGNCVYVLNSGLKHLLMTYSFVFFSILAVMVFDLLEIDDTVGCFIRRAIPILCAVLLLNHVLYANQWYIRNDMYSRAGMSFMTRLVADMEETEGYEVGRTPVLILGHIDENPASYSEKGYEIANDGMTHHLSISYYQTYDRYFRFVLGYPVNMVPLSEVAGYLEDPEIQAMPIYPAKGAIQIINGVLVIRLSDDLRPEELRLNIATIDK